MLALMSIPTYYWVSNNQLDYLTQENNVKGVSTMKQSSTTAGFGVSIVSSSATWDFVEYLCKTESECLSDLNSGRRLGTVSGGETDLHEVVIEYTPDWNDYEYVKYFVRSGWNSTGKIFNVVSLGEIPGSELYEITEGGEVYNVVLAPISSVKDSFYRSATFSDL
jgi:hypothetical protein